MEDMRRCPYCGNVMSKRECPKCGYVSKQGVVPLERRFDDATIALIITPFLAGSIISIAFFSYWIIYQEAICGSKPVETVISASIANRNLFYLLISLLILFLSILAEKKLKNLVHEKTAPIYTSKFTKHFFSIWKTLA